MNIVYTPIGHVRNAFPSGRRPPSWRGTTSQIEVLPQWAPALDGLADFSHVLVLCYLHLSPREAPPTRIRPQGNPEMPLVGLFSTRSPHRPNPISLSIVPLVAVQGAVLQVRDLDMYDGTPVLDIKPHLPGDCPAEAVFPEWVHRLRGRTRGGA